MQIKEAARLSALTERAVRLYEERGLIAPDITNKNGRDFRDYSDETVRRLKTISALRRALFTIDEIKEMLDDPSRIPEITEANRSRMREDSRQLAVLLSRLDAVDTASVRDAKELSRALFAPDESEAAMAGCVDDSAIYAERYRDIYDKYFAENTGWDRRYSTSLGVGGALSAIRRFFARRVVRVCLIVLAVAVVLATVLPNVSAIDRVNRKYYGSIHAVETDERGELTVGDAVGDPFTLTFSGKIKKYLFRDTTIEGSFDSEALKNIFYPTDEHTFTMSGTYTPYDRGVPDIYKSDVFLCGTAEGTTRVCELFTTSTFHDVIIMMYNTQTTPFEDNNGDKYTRGGQLNQYYYRFDGEVLIAMLGGDGRSAADSDDISTLLYRVMRAIDDQYSYSSYVFGFDIR